MNKSRIALVILALAAVNAVGFSAANPSPVVKDDGSACTNTCSSCCCSGCCDS